MAFKDTLLDLRKQRGMTQAELAAELYVTRQAVSRWETGQSEPGVDMRKLIARALDASPAALLGLPDEPVCQSCGTPFSVPNMARGTEADGTRNPSYCQWCYDGGSFTADTLDEVVEQNAPYYAAAAGVSAEEAVSFLGAALPQLGRWREGRQPAR